MLTYSNFNMLIWQRFIFWPFLFLFLLIYFLTTISILYMPLNVWICCIPMYFNCYNSYIIFIDLHKNLNQEWIDTWIFSSYNINHTTIFNIFFHAWIKVFHDFTICTWSSRPNMHFCFLWSYSVNNTLMLMLFI